jgi:hypothetical protein
MRPKGGMGGKGGYSGLKPVRAKLFSSFFTGFSSANTNYSDAIGVNFNTSNFSELPSWGVLYDMCRILHFKVHGRAFVNIPTTASNNLIIPWAFAVSSDPTAGAPTSVGQVLDETFNCGLHYIASPGVSIACNTFTVVDRPITVSAHFPKLAPITTSDCPGSAWFVLDGSTAPVACVVQSYIGAAGAASVTGFTYIVELEVEFKIRT